MTSLWFLCQGGIADEARREHAATTGPCAGAAPSGRTRSASAARRDRGLRSGGAGRGRELWRDRRAAGGVLRVDPPHQRVGADIRTVPAATATVRPSPPRISTETVANLLPR